VQQVGLSVLNMTYRDWPQAIPANYLSFMTAKQTELAQACAGKNKNQPV
jgi:hypothetical protein